MNTIKITRVDGTTYEDESNSAVVYHGIDSAGNYLGLVPPGDAFMQVQEPPPVGTWAWDFSEDKFYRVYSLPEKREQKWTQIKVARAEMEFGGFVWDLSTFDSDEISQSRIQGAAQLATLAMLASEAFSIPWTLADNTVRTLSGAEMIAVGREMGIHIATAHAIGRSLRDAIEAATTDEELEAITWP